MQVCHYLRNFSDLIYPSTEALNKMYNLEEITDVFFRDLFGGVNPLE